MRFSLRWLFVAVAFVAISVVALLNANNLWHAAIWDSALLLLLVAFVGGIWSTGHRRAFCFGYFIFAFTYFVFASGFFGFTRQELIVTTNGLQILHAKLFEPEAALIPPGGSAEGDLVSDHPPLRDGTRRGQLPDGSLPVMIIRPGRSSFVALGNALACIPFGLIGGFIATWFYSRRDSLKGSGQ